MPSLPFIIGADDGEDTADPMQSAFDSIRAAVDEAERDMMMERDKEEEKEPDGGEPEKPEELRTEDEGD